MIIANNRYKRMLEVRKKLPSYKMRDEIITTIRDNQVVVVSGETGKFELYTNLSLIYSPQFVIFFCYEWLKLIIGTIQ